MDVLWMLAVLFAPLVLVAVGLLAAERYAERDRRDLRWWQRALLTIGSSNAGLGAGLSRMAELLPRSWSEHPESKHPRHPDRWPPR